MTVACIVGTVFLFSYFQLYSQDEKKPTSLKSAQAIEPLFNRVEKEIYTTAAAMPADKYQFVPANGEFKDVRNFGQQVKHLSAINFILGARVLGEQPSSDTGDETGPDSVRTKVEILNYLKVSFDYLHKAMDSIDERNRVVRSSSISPIFEGHATRLGLVVEALIHDSNHYGQMVEYLRMNNVIPPASR